VLDFLKKLLGSSQWGPVLDLKKNCYGRKYGVWGRNPPVGPGDPVWGLETMSPEAEAFQHL